MNKTVVFKEMFCKDTGIMNQGIRMSSKKPVKALFRSNTSKTIFNDSTLQLHLAEEEQESTLVQIGEEKLLEKVENLKNRSKSTEK